MTVPVNTDICMMVMRTKALTAVETKFTDCPDACVTLRHHNSDNVLKIAQTHYFYCTPSQLLQQEHAQISTGYV